MTTRVSTHEAIDREPRSRSLRHTGGWGERTAEVAIRVVALVSIAAILLILLFVGKEALPLLTSSEVHKEVTLGGMFAPLRDASGDALYAWQPVSEVPKYNVFPLIVGSLKVTVVALVLAVPISVAAAVFVSEYAGPRMREVVKPAIELLAGIPSVVVGFFALIVMATWVQTLFGTEHRLNALVAGVGLAFAICPIVFSVSEDALRAVPRAYREAALAMGSTRAQTVVRVVVPAAAPGIAASIVLGFGRAIGETMIVVIASGNAALLDASLDRSTRTITATIAQELGEVVVGSPHYDVLFALGAMLFIATFVINFFGERIVHGMRRKLGTVS
ncbi:MAG TPA: phosphate ABC transporter permease subunit PstC [Polyangiaceae bacterium]|nr:phosphate ABC transporter permease subunit PstC [Polyangiaceae bacterium]